MEFQEIESVMWFIFRLRGRPEYEIQKNEMKKFLDETPPNKKPDTLDKLCVLIASDKEDELYPEAMKDYETLYSGATNKELLDYVFHLIESYGFKTRRKRITIPEHSFL